MVKIRKIAVLFAALAVIAVFPLFGAGKSADSSSAKGAASAARDLGGISITIGQWYSDYDVNTFKPENAEAERTLAWRKQIQKDYNFTMRETNIGGWAQMQELASTSIMAGDPAASIFIMQPAWAITLYNQGLLYPVSDLKSVDFSKTDVVNWNPDVISAFTFNGKAYAFIDGYGTGAGGVGLFFNKRLFREAGIDPELPYNLQKAGTWTWDAFIDLCKKLNRDINNDGIIDTYALATFSTDTLSAIVASNDARYVDKEPGTGTFVNSTNRPEFLQALQFAVRLAREGYLMPQPEGSNWDWFISAFHDGKAAMRAAGWYVRGELQDMSDDWGFVAFPKGPRSKDYRRSVVNNVYIIPSTFSPADADKILYGLYLWLSPPQGTNTDPDAWKAGEYNLYRDARAVDETLPIFRNPKSNIFAYNALIPGLSTGNIAYNMWNEGADPAQLIESIQQSWDATIAKANGGN